MGLAQNLALRLKDLNGARLMSNVKTSIKIFMECRVGGDVKKSWM